MIEEADPSVDPSAAEPVRVTIPFPRMSSPGWGIAYLVGIAAAGIYVAGAFPSFAVRMGLPLAAVMATFFVRAACVRTSPTVCTFDARGLRFESTGYDGRTPWSLVTRIATTKTALVIEGVDGVITHIPWSANPDVRGILALAPKRVVFQTQDTGAARGPAWRTLVLWIFLIVMMMAIYSLVAQEPPP